MAPFGDLKWIPTRDGKSKQPGHIHLFELSPFVYAGYKLQEVSGVHARFDAMVGTGTTRMQ